MLKPAFPASARMSWGRQKKNKGQGLLKLGVRHLTKVFLEGGAQIIFWSKNKKGRWPKKIQLCVNACANKHD